MTGKLQNSLLAVLPYQERERLAPYLEPAPMELRQMLVEADAPIRYTWFPHDAVTSTVVDTPDGTTIEVGVAGAEGMVGLSLVLNAELSNTTAIVQVAGSGTRMRADHFRKHVVVHGGELYQRLLRYTNAFMAMVAQTAACNGLHTIDQRLSRCLLMMHDRIAGDTFPLTHEFLAYMLGVRRPSVSVAANALLQSGYIHYTRGNVRIVDRQALEKVVCPCYGIVKSSMAAVVPPDHESPKARDEHPSESGGSTAR